MLLSLIEELLPRVGLELFGIGEVALGLVPVLPAHIDLEPGLLHGFLLHAQSCAF